MKNWTHYRPLLVTYQLTQLTKKYWLQINYTLAVLVTGIYFGTLLGQGI